MSITIPAPVDMHVHFRQDELLKKVVPHHDRVFEYALAMPNTTPPIRNGGDVIAYKKLIQDNCKRMKPLVAIKLTETTVPTVIAEAQQCGAIAAKLYPEGVTTNSDDGISFKTLYHLPQHFCDVLGTMQEIGMVLCVHGETPGDFCMSREYTFLNVLRKILTKFPKLKVVLEHITCYQSVCLVQEFENLAATITLHHLLITLDDVVGDKIAPHNFCKPIAKTPTDLYRLRETVGNHPRIFFGSDSAPHTKENKECAFGCAGCYTAPLLLDGLAHVLSLQKGAWHHPVSNLMQTLKEFTSDNARAWYGLPAPGYEVTLNQEEWTVPNEINGVVPFLAGHKLKWKVAA